MAGKTLLNYRRHDGQGEVRRVRRWLVVGFLATSPVGASAQVPPWKAVSCVAEAPDFARGLVETIYFAESGRVWFHGREVPATVTAAEVSFCLPSLDAKKPQDNACYAISRVTGRDSYIVPKLGMIAGTCTAQNTTPKF